MLLVDLICQERLYFWLQCCYQHEEKRESILETDKNEISYYTKILATKKKN